MTNNMNPHPAQLPLLLIQRLSQTTWPGHFAAFAAGILFAFGLSPYDWWPLTLLSIVLFLLLTDPNHAKKQMLRSWIYGFGIYLHGMSWIFVSVYTYGGTPLAAAIPLTFSFVTLFTLFFFLQSLFFFKSPTRLRPAFTLPALWVLCDWFRSWFLTGCPWLFAGYAFIDTPLAGYAPIFGVYGVTFAAILSATLLFSLLRNLSTNHDRKPPLYHGLLLVSIWIVGAALNSYTWVEIDETKPGIRVSMVQGNISQDQKWREDQRQPTFDLYANLTRQEVFDADWNPNIILWPEAALPAFHHESLDYLAELKALMIEKNANLITGVLSAFPSDKEDDSIYYNSVVSTGNHDAAYHKQKLVPFGEVYPFTEEMKSIVPFYGQLKSFTPGDPKQQPLTLDNSLQVSPFICYEVIYPDFVRNNIKGSDFLLTVSNDAWFGSSIAPWQHFQMARMRALENGRYMIRGTNTGVTGVIDHKGKVRSVSPQFERLVHRGTLHTAKGMTPYTEYGNKPLLITVLTILVIVVTKRARS